METLDSECRAFLESNPYTFTDEFDPETGWYVARIKVRRQPGPDLGVIFGDFVHNLRATLDNLCWQLVIANDGKPGRWNHFPIFEREDSWRENVIVPRERGKESPLLGVSDLSVALIEQAQPYARAKRGPELTPLAVLKRLSDADKHQLVHGSYFAMEAGDVDLSIRHNESIGRVLEHRISAVKDQRLKDGTELFRARFSIVGPNPQVQMEGTFPAYVAFAEETRPVMHTSFPKIGNFVETILSAAERSLVSG